MNQRLASLLQNKQALGSVAAMVLLEVVPQIAALWFSDSVAEKIYETCRILNKAVVGYAIIMTAAPPAPKVEPPLTPGP